MAIPIFRVVVAISDLAAVLAEIRPVPSVVVFGRTNGTLNDPVFEAVKFASLSPLMVRMPVRPEPKPAPATMIFAPGAAASGT